MQPPFAGRSTTISPVYLDTAVLRKLVRQDAGYEGSLDSVFRMVRTGELSVHGSGAQIDELARLAIEYPDEFARIESAFWKLVGYRFLLNLPTLLDQELNSGKRVTCDSAFVQQELIPVLRAKTKRQASLQRISVRGTQRKEAWASATRTLGDDIAVRMKQALGDARYNEKEMSIDVERVEAALGSCLTDREKSRIISESARSSLIDSLPLHTALVSFELALAKCRMCGRTRIDANDCYDQLHYVYAAISGTLIIDDRRLHSLLRHIEVPIVRILTGSEFCKVLQAPQ